MHFVQDIDTSGARAVEAFVHQGGLWLAVPQLAQDIPGQPASMMLGDSDVDALIYRWESGQFVLADRIPVPGGEDAEFFEIDGRAFLATASLRCGAGPYTLDAFSVVYESIDGRWVPFQRFATFAAKQWKHFAIGARHFLALAQGVVMPGQVPAHPGKSCIYEWDGAAFQPFQEVRSGWGYNWAYFEVAGQKLLAYVDHVEPSQLLRWNGTSFEDFQTLDGKTGRACCFFRSNGQDWLAFANLHHDSVLYRWSDGRFVLHQTLSGPGGREFTWIDTAAGGRLVQINFLHGTREAPITALQSCIYRFEGDRLVVAHEFGTLGGTDVTSFVADGCIHLVVANSLSEAVRFRTPSKVYRLDDVPEADR